MAGLEQVISLTGGLARKRRGGVFLMGVDKNRSIKRYQ